MSPSMELLITTVIVISLVTMIGTLLINLLG